MGDDLFWRAFGDDLAAMDTGARAHIDDMVSGQDSVFVMLDNEHRVAEVAQAFQGLEQAFIVPLVEADAWLVEHVEHALQARADLAGETDALALAARQRAGGARQGEVFKADRIEEDQPVIDFLQDAGRDFLLLIVQRVDDLAEPVASLLDREFGAVRDIEAVDLYRERFGLQALAIAGRAGGGGLEL